jgi:hypothetical protein
MAAEFRVFLSAVMSEFGSARDALANDLQARDVQVRVQRSFRHEAESDTLLRLLHDYIRDCSAVVCLIGTRSGACPPPFPAAPFRDMLPTGVSEASYTQWEFFFARAHKRRLSLYIAAADYQPARLLRAPGRATRIGCAEPGRRRRLFSGGDRRAPAGPERTKCSADTYRRTNQELSRPAACGRGRAAAAGVRHGFPSLRLQATRHNSARAASSALTICRGALGRLREAAGRVNGLAFTDLWE